MKMNLKYTVALCMALTTGASVFAQTANTAAVADSTKQKAETYHRIGAYADAGFSMLPLKSDYNKNGGSFGAGLGLVYELNKGHFLFDVQAGFQLYNGVVKVNDFSCLTGASISSGQGQGDFKYNFKNYREQQMMGQAEVALLFGAEFNRFYFLVGPKVGAALMGSYKVKTDASTSFQDKNMIGEFTDMDNHNFTSFSGLKPQVDDKKLKFKTPNVMLSAEVGYDIWMKNQSRLRLGAFLDYGLLNIHDYAGNQVAGNAAQNYPLVAVTGAPSDQNIQSYTALGNGEIGDAKQNSFLAGIKLTYTYQLKKKVIPPPPLVTPNVVTIVTNKKTGAPVDTATVTFYNLATNKINGTRKTNRTTGIAVAHLKAGEYNVVAKRNNFLPDSTTYKCVEYEQLKPDMPLKNDTIYIALQPMPVYTNQVFDIETGEVLNATATLIDQTTGKEVKKLDMSKENPKMTVQNLDPTHKYAVSVSAPGYMSSMEDVEDVNGSQTIYMSPIRKGAKIILKNLFFVYAKTTLLDESKPELDRLEQFMYDNPDVSVMIVGHTDNIGTDESNQKLSEGRAKAVVDAMIARGVKAERMQYDGKGESQPIATNDTDEGRQQNRRVELVVQ